MQGNNVAMLLCSLNCNELLVYMHIRNQNKNLVLSNELTKVELI